MVVQHFLDCVDRATASSTAFVSFREQPMHFKDNQTLNLRVVDPIADEGVWPIINSCCYGEVWRPNAEAKMKILGLHPIRLHREATTFNGVGTSTTSGKLKISRPYDCRNPAWWYPGACIRTRRRHIFLLVSLACQAKLGMTKRVCDGSITLDDCDAQSLEVARQVGTGLFMIRIHHLIYNDHD